MDNNLLQWKSRGQSFLSRLRTWFNLLDATLLLSSDAEILKAHALLGSKERLNEKDEAAVTLSLILVLLFHLFSALQHIFQYQDLWLLRVFYLTAPSNRLCFGSFSFRVTMLGSTT
ncbi:hypothetical protein XENOCAPTIV_004864 [Xenoophorus captivus]|uniref:Uncharacterized protein n=1 Tax=Xenoophorus captivus TaxID=1517983 RepID=A0ABV0R6Y2_9TELE